MRHTAALLILSALLCGALIAGCSSNSAQSAESLILGGTLTPSPEINITIDGTSTPVIVNTLPTDTPAGPPPTATSDHIGLAARVNNQPIPLDEFNAEMARYLAADPSSPSPDSAEGKTLASQLKDNVLETLIEQMLIEQEATRLKVTITDKQVDDEVAALVQIRGGQDKFDAWLSANKQTPADVRDSVRHELIASAMRDRVVEQLPRTAEYVHAYHIVVAAEAEGQNVLARLRSGARFTTLAQSVSIDSSTRADGGDLGWFTRGTGSVVWNEVEDAAFALKAGQLSPIIHSPIGYHIIKVVDRQTRALTPDDMSFIQQAALEQWMTRLKSSAKTEKFI
jgi:parvulin-like peptidyl-prolyl isomerase